MEQAETYDAWARVLNAGCGTVVDDADEAEFVIVNEDEECDLDEYEGMVVVETAWISQCLIVQSVIDTKEYLRGDAGKEKVVESKKVESKGKERVSKGGSAGSSKEKSVAGGVKERPPSTRRSSRRRN
jgi:hypothetical protein